MTNSTRWISGVSLRSGWLLGAVLTVLAVLVGLVLWAYGPRPSAGTFFLGLGAVSLTAVAVLLLRAAQDFDLSTREDSLDNVGDRLRGELEREKRILLKAIREVEFDRDTSKLD